MCHLETEHLLARLSFVAGYPSLAAVRRDLSTLFSRSLKQLYHHCLCLLLDLTIPFVQPADWLVSSTTIIVAKEANILLMFFLSSLFLFLEAGSHFRCSQNHKLVLLARCRMCVSSLCTHARQKNPFNQKKSVQGIIELWSLLIRDETGNNQCKSNAPTSSAF